MAKNPKTTLITVVIIALIAISGIILYIHYREDASHRITSSKPMDISQVKVAILYENIIDGNIIGRDIDDTIKILRETHTDLIFRGFWKWAPVVNSPDNIPPELLELAPQGTSIEEAAEALRRSGHYYQELERWISAIKKEMPEIIFVGAIPAQTLARIEYNPITGKVYSEDETWAMALDPQKWGIYYNGRAVTKYDFQKWFYGIHPYGGEIDEYDRHKVPAYFPDITNPDFQELLLSWAKRQIDCGADAIWIDMLYTQASILLKITGDVNHPAVRDSIEAAKEIVNKIHEYGEQVGRPIYVGSWVGPFVMMEFEGKAFPYSPPDVDFVTVTMSNQEILNKQLDEEKWKNLVPIIKRKYGNIPIFSFIDWAFDNSQMVMFSQKLSKEEQREVLRVFDKSFEKLGINFIYPVHGGYMGRGELTTKLSFGKYRFYDALAPEFQTYDVIKELALEKAMRPSLSDIEVAIQYRIVTDGSIFNRSLDDVINILRETNADFVFQGWLTQWPLPEDFSEIPINLRKKYEDWGYSYSSLKDAVSEIKKELPNIIFCGGVQFEYLYPEEVEGGNIQEKRDNAWNMSLNPEKWGINFSRIDMQYYWAKRWGFLDKLDQYPSEEELKQKMPCYFPDITNPDFQEIFLDRIYKQIDAGVDAIWIDMLYAQPTILKQLTKSEDHPAVKESYEAIWNIIDKIYDYGYRYGKKIFVISWVVIHRENKVIELVPPEWCNIDAAMTTPLPEEILSIDNEGNRVIGRFNEDVWNKLVNIIKKQYHIPIFARIDYGGTGRTPINIFSQELTKGEAREFLIKADSFFSSKGIIFIYPVHGGDMGPSGEVLKLSYGKFNWYDSLAPEFDTYETIKKNLLKKKVAITYPICCVS